MTAFRKYLLSSAEVAFRRLSWVLALGLLISLIGCGSGSNGTAGAGAAAGSVPDIIALPAGFQPEGVAISGNSLFVGSIPSGRVFKVDITTGLGRVLVESIAGRNAIGLKVDERGRLFVAGGQTGQAYVYDAGTGAAAEVYTLALGNTFINDVIVTPQAAWFTDSRNPVLYRVPINPDGSLGTQAEVTSLALTGEFVFVPEQNNANGIAAVPDGSILIIVQISTGKLFTVNPATGAAREINLGAESVPNGDGILLQDQTLFVVQNRLNQLAVITLSTDFTTGVVEQRITNPAFDVPTTVAASDGSLYLVNARFGIANPETAEYSVVRIDKPAPAEIASIGLALVAENLNLPVALVEPPDGSNRLFILEQGGLIRIVLPDGSLLPQPFLDLQARVVAGGERGLLGLAFHPDFVVNGRLFVYYSAALQAGAPAGFDHTSHISEFLVDPLDANLADPASERILLQVDQPQGNHNAGTVVFGPDGFLYISLGDGGGANDVGLGHVEDWYPVNAGGNGQDVTDNLLGSILRIDVDGGIPYGIPPDNPFVGLPGLDEIFAYGFRNPYRMSFDMAGSNQLFAGDVGQAMREEVDIVVRGGNYGWNVKEGTLCFSTTAPGTPLADCPAIDPEGDPIIDPIIEFVNSNQPGGLGNAVIGGHVYRGSALPGLTGRYVFGSLSATGGPDGRILVATPAEQGLWPFNEPVISTSPDGRLGRLVMGFGQDSAGEIYVLTIGGPTGEVFRIVAP